MERAAFAKAWPPSGALNLVSQVRYPVAGRACRCLHSGILKEGSRARSGIDAILFLSCSSLALL